MNKIPQRRKFKMFCFSGGRTSALMLRSEMDKNPNFKKEFIVCFCNTGKERNETLDFVHEIETRWDVPIIWLEYCRVIATSEIAQMFPTPRRVKNAMKKVEKSEFIHWFKIVDYQSASRNGEPFDDFLKWTTALPNATGRGCSAELKTRTAMRYFFYLGAKEFECFIGIRADESHRSIQILSTCENFIHPKFPLIEDGVSVFDVDSYWKNSDFDLMIKSYEGNCDLCFLKSKWKRMAIMRQHPEFAKWWIKKETEKDAGIGSTFILNQSYEATLKNATHPELNLFGVDDNDIPCSCAEKGFESKDSCSL